LLAYRRLFCAKRHTVKPQEALARRQRKQAELKRRRERCFRDTREWRWPAIPGSGCSEVPGRNRTHEEAKTFAAYTTALNYFTESCRKLYLHEIERHDLLKFAGFLRDEKELSPRSVYNKFEVVMTFLKANGIRGLAGKNDWPRYTEEEPEMYEQEELYKLFKACNEEERL